MASSSCRSLLLAAAAASRVSCRRCISSSSVALINCHRSSITRISKPAYCQMYPALIVASDGSTTHVGYHKPRKIVVLPLDLATLTEAERLARIENRKPKTKVVIEEEFEDNIILDKYAHLWKK